MRSVPRISSDMNRVKRKEKEFEPIFEIHESKTVFYAPRRDFLYTKFIEDPQLVLKRQKELEEENLNNIQESQIQSTDTSTSLQITSPPSSPPPPPPPHSVEPSVPIHSKINKKQNNQKNQKEPSDPKPRPIKKLTRTEISNVIDRLLLSNDNTSPFENHRNRINNKDIEKSPIRKKYADCDTDEVFERLYCESTQRKTEKKPISEDHDKQVFRIPESDEEILTKSLALQKIKEMIDTSFPEKQGLTLSELKDVFIRLGIIDNCEKMEKITQISYIIEKWKIRNTDLYDSNIIKNTLTQSIIGRKGKFRNFARERMFSYLANRKNNENSKSNQQPLYSNQSEFQINHSKKLTQETFDRLLSPRPDFSPPKNEEEEDFNYIPIELSPRTQKILKDSEYGNIKLEERDRKLTEKAMAKIESIRNQMEKERLKILKKKHCSPPRISPEERVKIDELKAKRQKEIENEQPSYKPDIMKYSDFLQLKESMVEEKEKPPGFDAFLGRIKKGYEQQQKKKFEEENIRSLPQLPSKKRSASVVKKKKKEKPPSDHQETPEQTEQIEPIEPIQEPNIKNKPEIKEQKNKPETKEHKNKPETKEQKNKPETKEHKNKPETKEHKNKPENKEQKNKPEKTTHTTQTSISKIQRNQSQKKSNKQTKINLN